ncbi:glycosyltransferase family 1 protein [Vibrio sp. SM6]|uniref:Glycosyltransferase family 1 protein n=1 Tax=Vibrio agarilyticus TaxID=2726741 RepID=A0A7X8TQ72_9VIBR|nr:glycosyltransferase [Vibrio agarilyticus]NLS12920.1 glycosyltransferase family 1 protein [Vibrio agarilyticus]
MKRDLIVFGEDWGGLPSSTQHLIKRLAASRKVIWVNSIGLRQPKLNRHDVERLWRKLRAVTTANRNTSMKGTSSHSISSMKSQTGINNITIVAPKTIPAPKSRLARKLAAASLSKQLKPVIERAQLHDPIMWTSLPTAVDLFDKLPTRSLVYYCGDDFSTLAGVDHDTVAMREQELVTRSNLILAASESLVAKFPPERTQLLTHGVDHDLFSRRAPPADSFSNNSTPIAGFYGSLSEWLDYPLLRQVIEALPHWHFIFIGAANTQAQALGSYANVSLLGPLPHHELPRYSQHWNVSLLPFVDNGQIRACNPLKLREYLAAGRPVVSTPFPALAHYRDYVTQVRNAHEMIAALEKVKNHSTNTAQQRAVAQDTWDARADQLSNWLENL